MGRELLDDFFAESDEHLTSIRRALALLESSDGTEERLGVLTGLFRDFHSFKGIAAIAGLRQAEEIAHAAEDYLRDLTKFKVALTAGGVSLLMATAEQLEQRVLAFRSGAELPQSAELLRGLRELASAVPDKEEARLVAPKDKAQDENAFLAPAHLVRVDLKRLDDLMRLTGEMVIQRSRFEQALKSADSRGKLDLCALQEVNNGFNRSLGELREAIMRVRLVSVSEIFARMPFVVSDLARGSGRKAHVTLEGAETQMDKYLIEQLKDPLLHLVRNAFAHGIEPSASRVAAGKPAEGRIHLSATTMGDRAALSVEDDGAGINTEEVLRKARKMGMTVAPEEDPLLRVLCSEGFTTREEADRASGRGIGMAVVWSKVRELGGTLSVETTLGRGTTFRIWVPLSLAITQAVLLSASGETYAMPQSFVTEVKEVSEEEITLVSGSEVVQHRGDVLPVTRLASRLGLPRRPAARMGMVVLASPRGSCGLLVDRIFGQQEVVVRGIQDPLLQVRGISGATELGDGKPVLILDGEAFMTGVVRPPDKAGLTQRA